MLVQSAVIHSNDDKPRPVSLLSALNNPRALSCAEIRRIRPNPANNFAQAGFARICESGRMPDMPEPEPKSGTSVSAL